MVHACRRLYQYLQQTVNIPCINCASQTGLEVRPHCLLCRRNFRGLPIEGVVVQWESMCSIPFFNDLVHYGHLKMNFLLILHDTRAVKVCPTTPHPSIWYVRIATFLQACCSNLPISIMQTSLFLPFLSKTMHMISFFIETPSVVGRRSFHIPLSGPYQKGVQHFSWL